MKHDKIRGSEEKYYGSGLNKFIAENCKKNMTVMNIDLITYDRDKKHIRIIESKHLRENWLRARYSIEVIAYII